MLRRRRISSSADGTGIIPCVFHQILVFNQNSRDLPKTKTKGDRCGLRTFHSSHESFLCCDSKSTLLDASYLPQD
jgi:hypothetical protein